MWSSWLVNIKDILVSLCQELRSSSHWERAGVQKFQFFIQRIPLQQGARFEVQLQNVKTVNELRDISL
jgi:hypothetical protein